MFFGFFAGYALLLNFIPKLQLTGPQSTLFSINSFLFGLYFVPVLNAQKTRINELTKCMRAEAVLIYKALVKTRLYSD
jgi:hypothetical protein